LVIRNRLSGLKGDLNVFITNLLLEAHEDSFIVLLEGEATFVEEGINVLKLRIVLILVLDLLFKSPTKLFCRI